MHVKRIEINGFKSFANNTVLEFPKAKNNRQSLTAVVGPNGSGKSNIVDAIRWVLGEQSMKHLRGKKSEDIIFAGSEGKGKMSLASVTMILDNKDKRAKVDYDELVISRKIYRSGESEYVLNGKSIRLLDLQILLAQAQFGQGSYSVISQGTIDKLLLQTPAERKSFFDEAVGIKEFQIKRHHAALKLNRTSENIAQATGLLQEIEPRLKSLKRQVSKLEKRQEVELTLREYQEEYYYTLHANVSEHIDSLQSEFDEVNALYNTYNENLLHIQKELATLAQEKSRHEVFQELQREYQNLGQKKNNLEREQAVISSNLQTEFNKVGKQNVGWLENKIEEFTKLEKNVMAEIEANTQRAEHVSHKVTALANEIDERQSRKIKLQNKAVELERQLNDLSQGKDSVQFDGLRAVNAILDRPKGSFGSQVYGVVAQLAKVDEKYRLALEVAAQSHLASVVVEDDRTAQTCIDFLKKQRLGFATFLPLNKIKRRFVPKDIEDLVHVPGVYGLASSLVDFDPMFVDIFSYVFGSTLIIEDIEVAREIGIGRVRMVTLEGDIMETSGSMKGGFRQKRSSVLSFAGGRQDFSQHAFENTKKELVQNKAELDNLEIAIEQDKEMLVELKTAEKVEQEKMTLLQNRLSEVHTEMSKFKQELSMHSLSKEEYSEMMSEFALKRDDKAKEISAVEKELDGINKKIENLNKQEEEKRKRIFELQDAMQSEQRNLNTYSEKKHTLQVDIAKKETHRDDLEQEIFNELHEGVGVILEKELSQLEEQQLEHRKTDIEKLKYKLSLIGGIDEEVMGEYDETKERYDSLSLELDDLNKASADLEKMVFELDKLMKKKYAESFKKIKKEFSRYFKLLFEGGEADIVELYGDEKSAEEEELSEEESVGDESEQHQDKKKRRKILQGIEVYACPPGKKIKNISALSGGERTMTSIALLCAILNTNPSPFVILDEVEAALDEANTQRFTKILSELAMQSQFIVITHNRVTMHAVDVLYGVTMGNDGISKLVSVKLDT